MRLWLQRQNARFAEARTPNCTWTALLQRWTTLPSVLRAPNSHLDGFCGVVIVVSVLLRPGLPKTS